MNLQNFEKSYAALREARDAIGSYSRGKVISYYQREYDELKQKALGEISRAIEGLLEFFDSSFPLDVEDVDRANDFSFPKFFEMLKKYPELVESNENQLSILLDSLRTVDLKTIRLSRIPLVDEFISEENKLKKKAVCEALNILTNVEERQLQKELVPVVECLSARRPDVEKALDMLFYIRQKTETERTKILAARELLKPIFFNF